MPLSLRQLLFRRPVAPPQDLSGRTFIVTGAAPDSIGYATARQLLEWGAEVTVTRRSGSAELVKHLQQDCPCGDRLSGHDLDIADAISVKKFSQWYINDRKKLDVLINCAGIHLDLLSQWQEPRPCADGVEIHWRTNYLGSVHLTHALLPLLLESARQSRQARIVNVVSMLHQRGLNREFFHPARPYHSWDAYGQSKLALVHFTFELQRRYGAQGLQAYCLHPGEVFTNVAGKGLAGNPVIEAVRNFFAPLEGLILMTPFEGAQTSLLCATAPSAEGGHYYRNCTVAKASPEVEDVQVAAKLWEENLKWISTLAS